MQLQNIKYFILLANPHPLDWPFTLFSANFISLMSFTPKVFAIDVMSASDVHWKSKRFDLRLQHCISHGFKCVIILIKLSPLWFCS